MSKTAGEILLEIFEQAKDPDGWGDGFVMAEGRPLKTNSVCVDGWYDFETIAKEFLAEVGK